MVWPFTKKTAPQQRRHAGPGKRVRYYNAGGINRLTGGWTTQAKHPDEIVLEKLPTLRARSREQFANNDYMVRFVNLTRSNVVGPRGMTLQARAMDNRGNPDNADNQALERAFREWGRKGNCDASGCYTFADIQRLFMSTVVVDGEFLARELRSGPFGYQLQLLDPEHLDVTHNRADLKNGNTIKFSIEFDGMGAPVAYYIRVDAAKASNYSWMGKNYVRVPADEIIHCFVPERVGQKRGIPAAATAMLRMNMLSGYEDAAITAARVGASTMGFFTRNAEGVGYEGDDVDEDGAVITDVEPGVFEQLPEGVDFKAFDPDYPHQQFPEFVKACLRGISSGLGVSYHTLANDLEGVNYTSSRTGALEDREAWKALQEWMIENFLYRVYMRWLPRALKLGKITGPTGAALPQTRLDKFSEHTWQGRRWDWVDPLKDTQANALAVAHGLKSRAEIIRSQGRDPDQVWQELEAENARLADILAPVELNTATEEPDNVET